MIAIIDYDAGNLKSVEKALVALGETPIVTRDREEIFRADKAILPGVGSFGDAMEHLHRFGLVEVIKDFVASGKPSKYAINCSGSMWGKIRWEIFVILVWPL